MWAKGAKVRKVTEPRGSSRGRGSCKGGPQSPSRLPRRVALATHPRGRPRAWRRRPRRPRHLRSLHGARGPSEHRVGPTAETRSRRPREGDPGSRGPAKRSTQGRPTQGRPGGSRGPAPPPLQLRPLEGTLSWALAPACGPGKPGASPPARREPRVPTGILTFPQRKLLVRRLPLGLALGEQLFHGLGTLAEILGKQRGKG